MNDLPVVVDDEINEDAVESGMSFEALEKIRAVKVPKGVARLSMVRMSRWANEHGFEKKPKKTINRVNLGFFEIMLSGKLTPLEFLAYWKEMHDRLDGKAAQCVALTDPDGGKLEITWRES